MVLLANTDTHEIPSRNLKEYCRQVTSSVDAVPTQGEDFGESEGSLGSRGEQTER